MIRSENDATLCGGKTCFDSYALARRVARLSSQRHDQSIMAYHCPECGKWHNGTTRRAFKRMKTKR